MTTINTLDDFLNALDSNPAWREAVRARILDEELLQLPVRFDRFEKNFQEFRDETRENFERIDATLARHDQQMTELRTTIARHDGFFNNLMRIEYERRAPAGLGLRLARLLGLRRYYEIVTEPPGGPSELCHFLNQFPVRDMGQEQNAVDDEAFYDALRVDLAYQFELAGGEFVLAAGEASVTVETQDVDRARRRAAAIEDMTGTTTLPFVIGAAITPEAAEEAEKPGESPVRWLQMDEFPESD